MTNTVGIIGLGNIGGRVASVLLEAYDVFVFDIESAKMEAIEERGGTAVASAKAVGTRADVVFLSLPSDGALESATLNDGVVAGLTPDDVLIDLSTVSPGMSKQVADACAAAGVEFLDAPVSGGARNAETGTLTLLVGGSETALERVRTILETISETIHHTGSIGTGVTLKVINNYLFGLNQLVLSEGLTMARAAGISDETFAKTVADASGDSYALDRNMERFVIPDEYDSEFTLSLMRKDLALAEGFANRNDIPLLLGGGSGYYRLAEALGHGNQDTSAILKLYEAAQTDE